MKPTGLCIYSYQTFTINITQVDLYQQQQIKHDAEQLQQDVARYVVLRIPPLIHL